LAAAVLIPACLTSCGKKNDVSFIFATGGTGGTYFPYGTILAQKISDVNEYITIEVAATGASVENIRMIDSGAAHIAIAQNDVTDYAYNATHSWNGEAIKNICVLMSLYPEVCHLVVAADSDIVSGADLKGKRVSIGDSGSGVEANAIQIIAAYGLTVNDIYQENLGFASSVAALADGSIDAFFMTAGAPNTLLRETNDAVPLRIIGLSESVINGLISRYPYYTKATITHDNYPFLYEPVYTVAVLATLVASPAISDKCAYDIVKTIIENKNAISVAHIKGTYINSEYAVQGISIPMHPGAEKYFKEIGVLP